jgi:hypothetical protein
LGRGAFLDIGFAQEPVLTGSGSSFASPIGVTQASDHGVEQNSIVAGVVLAI